MTDSAKQKVVIIGCGNVAWHLAKHLSGLKKFDLTVYNHQANVNLAKFKTKLKCKTVVGLDSIVSDASVYFICVSDSFITETANKIKIKKPNALLLHTSGSAKLKDLGDRLNPVGVFYPLQSFSKDTEVDWSVIPILIETANRDTEHSILYLADLFSKSVYTVNYKSRLKMHLAAVLVNNFTNALYVSAFDLVTADSASKEVNFEMLFPLIEETTRKVKQLSPRAAQTGPAKRNNTEVMKKHLKLISEEPDLTRVYKQMSKLIVKQQKN
jgi:predicted short-subunit dehydrogenase-like oxidoreductase (DUF2520 family)